MLINISHNPIQLIQYKLQYNRVKYVKYSMSSFAKHQIGWINQSQTLAEISNLGKNFDCSQNNWTLRVYIHINLFYDFIIYMYILINDCKLTILL